MARSCENKTKQTCPSRGTVATIGGDDVSDGDVVTADESLGVEVFLKRGKQKAINTSNNHIYAKKIRTTKF